jgi:hypothetical protein
MEIVPGQRFVSRSTSLVWEVVGLLRTPHEPNLHVQLVREDLRYELKTLSSWALLQRRWYELVSTPPHEMLPDRD